MDRYNDLAKNLAFTGTILVSNTFECQGGHVHREGQECTNTQMFFKQK